mgnify:CR=1 FL=1
MSSFYLKYFRSCFGSTSRKWSLTKHFFFTKNNCVTFSHTFVSYNFRVCCRFKMLKVIVFLSVCLLVSFSVFLFVCLSHCRVLVLSLLYVEVVLVFLSGGAAEPDLYPG